MRRSVLLFASSLAITSADAGEMAKQGEESSTIYFVMTSIEPYRTEWTGIRRTDNGDATFDKMGVLATDLDGHGDSVMIDAEGDQIFTAWELGVSPYAGVFHYVRGTGKYLGISGEGTWTCIQLRAPGGNQLAICPQKSGWKLR
jgi:hypothetical protein